MNEPESKPNKIYMDICREFYNTSTKSWLKDNDIKMFSTHNEEQSVVAERFIRTLNNKMSKYMTSVSKNVNTDE